MDVINRVSPNNIGGIEKNQSELHTIFNEQGYSDYVIVYLRLITSGKLQEDAEFYQHFIEGDMSIEEFRHQEVEPMFKESDHIHIIALCAALGVGVRVEYLDRAEGVNVKAHDFPEGTQPMVFLIYRPGHYDILYPNWFWLARKLNAANMNQISNTLTSDSKTNKQKYNKKRQLLAIKNRSIILLYLDIS